MNVAVLRNPGAGRGRHADAVNRALAALAGPDRTVTVLSASTIDEALAACRNIQRPPLVSGATYSHYVACVDEPEALVADVARQGVELGRLIDYCVPDMPAYRNDAEQRTDFPVTRALNARVINLPLHVSEQQARDIAALVTTTLDARRDRRGHVVSPCLHA